MNVINQGVGTSFEIEWITWKRRQIQLSSSDQLTRELEKNKGKEGRGEASVLPVVGAK